VWRVRWKPLLAGLLAVILILGYASSAQQEKVTITGWVMVPAVESSDKGVLINITVTITIPGRGVIEVVGERGAGTVGETTRTSMVMAVKTGSLYAGYYWGSLDATIRIGTREEVEGPSGGFAIALLTYLMLITHSNVGIKGFAVTGAISPDGLAAKVGGVSEKCNVAQESGYTLILPLANVNNVGPQCRSMIPVGGLLSGLRSVKGAPEVSIKASYPLPGEYNRSMRETAQRYIGEAEKLLRNLRGARTPWTLEWVEGNITRARDLVDEHPYAAASLAFVAYVVALQSHYYVQLEERGVRWAREEISRLKSEVERLKGELDSKPRSGSVYYLEFLATAYSRLADANSTLYSAESLIAKGRYTPADVARDLGFAVARLDTVRTWVSIAERLREEKPVIREDLAKTIALIFGDYVRSSVEYASELVKYMIKAYNIPEEEAVYLNTYLDVVRGLLERADREASKGNYLAAVGFYREALSKSLSRIFVPRDVTERGLVDGYLSELSNLQSLLTIAIASRGLTSGLAPAYADYAMVRYRLGDYELSLGLLEEAVASTILWYTLALKAASLAGPIEGVSLVASPPPTTPGSNALDFYVVVTLAILLSFLLGVTFSAWLSSRATRFT
jgi:predicted S18 family serine protease